MIEIVRRVRATYGMEKVDRLFRTKFYFWPQTIARWKKEGLPDNYAETNLFGYDENPYAEQLVDLGLIKRFTQKEAIVNTISMDVVILDTSAIKDEIDYGGMLYELKNLGIKDGKAYQIDNGGDLLMHYHVYQKCRRMLKRFRVKIVN